MPTPWPEQRSDEAFALVDQINSLVLKGVDRGLDEAQAEQLAAAGRRLAELPGECRSDPPIPK